MPNDLLAELAQIEHVDDVKQANNDNLALIDGLELYAGNDDDPRPHARPRRPRRHPRGQPRGRREMRRMVDEPEQRAEIDARLQDVYAGDGRHHQPDPDQGRAEHARPPRRRPAAAARRGRRGRAAPRSAPCSSATACCRRPEPRMANGKLRVLPLGGLGEIGKNMTVVEYDGPHRRRRRRAALPDRRDARHRPRAARLRLPARAASTTSRRSSSPTATRTTSARCRGSCASSAGDMPRSTAAPLTTAMARSKLDEHRLKDVEVNDVKDGRAASSSGPFDVELVHMTHSIPDAMRGRAHLRPRARS